jgi:PKD domain
MRIANTIAISVLVQLIISSVLAQSADSSLIHVNLENNKAQFSSSLRSLRQIAGAPQAYYSYFWEFGDGSFSFRESPVHFYKDTGTYDVRLYATNNYDDGKPPTSRPKKTRIENRTMLASLESPAFFKGKGALEMKANRMPRPGEDMVLVVGYRNQNSDQPMKGTLVLFYNEKEFKANSFHLAEERMYHGEKRSSLDSLIAYLPTEDIFDVSYNSFSSGISTNSIDFTPAPANIKFLQLYEQRLALFRQNNFWRLDDVEKGNEKFFFLTLNTRPEMIKDTNAVVTISGMFVPDDPADLIETYDLELQIVASHDPNRMQLKNRRMNYRFTGKDTKLTYQVRFQNTGKGPSRNISLGIPVPGMLDVNSLELVDYYPKCVMCDSAYANQSCLDTIIRGDSIYFLFRNVYLPGLREEMDGDPDSTRGFVKYRIRFGKKLKKLPFQTHASIVFDNNKPISTNKARGSFRPGKSFGGIAGYNIRNTGLNKDTAINNNFFVGVTLSPYSPFRKYLQWEMFFSYSKTPEVLAGRFPGGDTIINGVRLTYTGRVDYETVSQTSLTLTPLQLRYNLTAWFGGGLGVLGTINMSERTTVRQEYAFGPPAPMTVNAELPAQSEYFVNPEAALFADIQAGKVRVGPAVGLRYLYYPGEQQSHFWIYATWRF